MLVKLLSRAEDRYAAIDAYNRHKNLTTRTVTVNGRQVLFLDPSIKATPAKEIMREALSADTSLRGRFNGFMRSALQRTADVAEAAQSIWSLASSYRCLATLLV